MNDEVIWIVFCLVYVSLKELEWWVQTRTHGVLKIFTNAGQGPWLRGDFAWAQRCNKPLHYLYLHCPSE